MRILLPCPVCGQPIDLVYQLGLPLTGFERDEQTGDLRLSDGSPWSMLTVLCESWPDCRGCWRLTFEQCELQTFVHPEQWDEGHPLAGKALQWAVSLLQRRRPAQGDPLP